MKTIAKLLALCLLLGTFAFAQNTPPASGDTKAATTDTSKPATDSKDTKEKKGKKGKKDKGDKGKDTKGDQKPSGDPK
jgi:hypothetical protein